ncbi:hypothetical protein TNIN_22961 [Trichonephila inaurata madagascariensis]|uniref:Uncharacterized protein n=1 Tax=Trichonephila inaurata madagascariensis TaxID=2747483 RepID=A0A8X6X9I2_9ARAC|nr:hypothetical protein TNIN_22961 [Trichonephila inaurata madagascariensis]
MAKCKVKRWLNIPKYNHARINFKRARKKEKNLIKLIPELNPQHDAIFEINLPGMKMKGFAGDSFCFCARCKPSAGMRGELFILRMQRLGVTEIDT